MNNFNDYYNYMIGNKNMPNNNPINNMNEMMNNMMNNDMNNFDNNMFQNTFMNNQNSPKLYKPNEGFTKGNMYANLYDPYKNYKPATIISRSEKEDLLNQIRMYKFAATDLSLYLDVNPKNNSNMIKLYNEYIEKAKELKTKYEKTYGPLTCDFMMPTNDFIWNNSPWPWESDL